LGVTLVVKQDEAANPGNVALLGAIRIVFEANRVADLVEEFFGTVIHDRKMRRD
jgi:hypothetical protein